MIHNFLVDLPNHNLRTSMTINADRVVTNTVNSLKANHPVLSIPADYLIKSNDMLYFNNEMGKRIPVWNVNHTRAYKLTNQDKLAILLICHKKDRRTKFRSYIDALPKDISNMPFFWSDRAMSIIENTPVHKKIMNYRSKIINAYNTARDVCNFELTKRDFCWARIIVSSRNFGIQVHGKNCSALAPFADMLNHSFEPNTRWSFEDDSDAFVMRSTRNVDAGTTMTDSYGAHKPADTFLLYYGFFPKDRHSIDGIQYDNNIMKTFPTSLTEDYERLKKTRDIQEKLALEYLITHKEMLSNRINKSVQQSKPKYYLI